MPLEAFMRVLEALEEQPVERFHPQQVILFGSHASGILTSDSDVDLHFPFTVDLLVRTPQHIAERIAMGDVFLREILSKGIVLYVE
jgi:predicted nucleotidyltransferase